MIRVCTYFLFLTLFFGCTNIKKNPLAKNTKWKAIHLLSYTSDAKIHQLSLQIPGLSKLGINVLFLEINYHFDFQSHTELRAKEFVTKEAAEELAKVCKENNIRLIPQFQAFGHQSWAETTFPLLTVYPELDLTPNAYPNNENIYCREWDPYNPKVNKIVFALIDEITAAFDADGIHLGMDEIFLINSPYAKSTKDKNPAEVFAKVVNDFHTHIVKEKGIEMFIWADRLIDGTKYKYGSWESSLNGTADAIDQIPKDVILCDWHYESRNSYPSIPMFIEKGFRVLPCSWKKITAVEKLIKYSYAQDSPNMLGHLFTTWSFKDSILHYEPMLKGISLIDSKKFYDVSSTVSLTKSKESVLVVLSTKHKNLDIFYTTDNSTPTQNSKLYKEPISVTDNMTIQAIAYKNGKPKGNISIENVRVHKGLNATVTINSPVSKKFSVLNGNQTLIDGQLGSISFSDEKWAGFDSITMDIELSFATAITPKEIQLRYIYDPANWIYPPSSIEVSCSLDGKPSESTETVVVDLDDDPIKTIHISPKTKGNITSIRIKGINRAIPYQENGYGNNSWIFIDEIIVH